MGQIATLAELLSAANPDHSAIVDSERGTALNYRQLSDEIETNAERIGRAGLEAGARVALVLASGPEFLVAFLALARARMVAAPLNLNMTAAEFSLLLEDGEARAVIVMGANPELGRAVARLSIPIWRLRSAGEKIEIEVPARGAASPETPAPDDVALFLHTSGTTSRPKGVPLTHRNLVASIANIASTYALTGEDRTMLVMPLFHVHGLMGAALSTLYSGGAVITPQRFSAGAFWPTAQKYRATWYTAVPTIHRTLLLRADSDAPAKSGFRFIRSCSSALAPSMLAEMEARFDAPVLEAYGMTEASHQIATNPLPPAAHKAGSVGRGGAVQVGIIDDAGNLAAAGTPGEVVIKGPNVMGGYYKNPEANAAAFTDGWLRTGDRGTIDGDGYISLIGRIKELINRGGEKISPLEIDAVLLSHPAVAEAASFGAPDTKYGEEVAAAIVLKAEATAAELSTYCGKHLADFKVPKAFHFVKELPKTASGKVQRAKLAATFARESR